MIKEVRQAKGKEDQKKTQIDTGIMSMENAKYKR